MSHFEFVGAVAAAVFLLLATRWLTVLRRTALDAGLPLSARDRLVAAAPIGYTVSCFLAAGVLADGFVDLAGSAEAIVTLPMAGSVARAEALWVVGVIAGLVAASPVVVVFTVESYLARKVPALVRLGRAAVWSMLSGVRVRDLATASAAAPVSEDERWKQMLRR